MAVAQLWIVRPVRAMTQNQREPLWNRLAIVLHVVGIVAALAAGSNFGDRESLDVLIFIIPTYAAFCFLAGVAAFISLARNERLMLLSRFVMFVSIIVFLLLLRLIVSHWSLGLEYWKKKL